MTLNSVDSVDSISYPSSHPSHPDVSDLSSLPYPVQKQRRTKWLIGSLALFLLTVASYLAYQRLSLSEQTNQHPMITTVERMNLAITVSANGTVSPEQVVNVSPKTAGILTKLLVKEGDRVTKGQAIAMMDDSTLQGQLKQSRAQLAQQKTNLNKLLNGNRSQEIAQAKAQWSEAQAKLQQLETGNRSEDIEQAQARLRQAQAKWRQAEDDLRRNQSLYSAGAISQQTVNQKRADRDSAKAQVNETQSALDLQNRGTRSEEVDQARSQVEQRRQAWDLLKSGARSEDIETAQQQVEAAEGMLQTMQSQINDTVIRAAFDGIVTRKYADPGAFVTPTTAGSSVSSATSSSILSLASTNQVVANVSESNISKIQIGQSVTITADAYPGKTFKGRVSQIATQAIVQQNVTSFEVKATLSPDAKRQLRSGMNVSINFNVGELQKVLTVPTIAVTRQQKITGVFIGSPNQPPTFKPIVTGATVKDRTEVKTGLDGTEHILIQMPPQSKAKSGLSIPGLTGGSSDGPPGGPPAGGPPGGPPGR
jgi:HlyD family secretion protein